MNANRAIEYKNKFNEEISSQRNIQTLLNCYIREFAEPENQFRIQPNSHKTDLPQAFKTKVGQILEVKLPKLNSLLLVLVDRRQAMGQCRFLSSPYLKQSGSGWQRLEFLDLAKLLLRSLSKSTAQPINLELLSQVINSVDNTQDFIKNTVKTANQLKRDTFIQAEQSLTWGHNWHPTPKSRSGITNEELMTYSPEVGASFQLHYLAVQKQYLSSYFIDNHDPVDFTRQLLPWPLLPDYAILPCHPWQYKQFSDDPLFLHAIRQGIVVSLGAQTEKFFPTSSVRTLYHPSQKYLIKSSLHIRLTNCLRKNAWYELKSAVNLTKLISTLIIPNHPLLNDFKLMKESASITLDLHDLEARSGISGATHLSEVFGLVFRENFSQKEQRRFHPKMAAALFSEDSERVMNTKACIKNYMTITRQDYDSSALIWFEHYVSRLVTPVLYYFFELGVIFEPHLQNTVIGFNNERPSRVYYRDLEGTKLIPNKWPAWALEDFSDRERESIYYSREKGWQRISYCLFVNNISEAIYALSEDNAQLEEKLWQEVGQQVSKYQRQFGQQPELQALLSGDKIACKTNFTTRLFKKSDKYSDYIEINNPISPLVPLKKITKRSKWRMADAPN